MRVLMTADAVGGVWTYALELAKALRRSGVETILAVLGGPLAAARRAETHGFSVHVSPHRLEWMDDPWDDVDAARAWLAALTDEIQPDVLHLNDACHTLEDTAIPTVIVGHSCVLSWWEAVHGEPAPVRYAEYAARVRAGLACADVVVTPTRAFGDVLDRLYGPLHRRVAVHNGIAQDDASPVAPRDHVVVAAGRFWDEAKNLQALDAAAERLSVPVRIAGDARGPWGRSIEARHVELLGALSRHELDACLARAAVLAHPARYEPFGLVPLEAAMRGCALVLGDIATLREVWGDAASYVPPDDSRALAEALEALVEDDALCSAWADRARRRARLYTIERQASAMLALYTDARAMRTGGVGAA
jgi:glycogen(starch) synthase